MALYYNFAFAAKEEQPIWMVKAADADKARARPVEESGATRAGTGNAGLTPTPPPPP